MPFIEALIKLKDGSERTIKAKSDFMSICLMHFFKKMRPYAKKENKLVHIKTDEYRVLNYLKEHLPDINVEFDLNHI